MQLVLQRVLDLLLEVVRDVPPVRTVAGDAQARQARVGTTGGRPPAPIPPPLFDEDWLLVAISRASLPPPPPIPLAPYTPLTLYMCTLAMAIVMLPCTTTDSSLRPLRAVAMQKAEISRAERATKPLVAQSASNSPDTR